MADTKSFGQWLKQQRKTLDLTQEQLATQIGCTASMIYKIEADERRPSKQIAELLAQFLNIPADEQATFIRFARGETTENPMPWGTAFQTPNNLPTSPTVLIGRDTDVVSIRKRLLQSETRLLTLIGPPGIGKTRLGLQVAHKLLDDFADGVFFVALASIEDAELVLKAIIKALDLREIGPQKPLERLRTYLQNKQVLLVLDNFEQVLATASQIDELLASCPRLKILVTSRVPLRIRRERQIPISPLALPDLAHLPDVETLAAYSAIMLFLERAQAVKPDFALTEENATTVAAICTRLDGLPLAIELISARVKFLTPSALLERLHGRLMLHSDGLRDIEPRHRTLNAAIDWSYQQLNTEEQTLFRRLGVFVGGWTLAAAEAICAEGLNLTILDGLAALFDKNLIKQEVSSNGETRFMLLETIREYALERLSTSNELETLQQQHANWFLLFVETSTEHNSKQFGLQWDQLEVEHDNLRAALMWSETELNGDTGLRLAMALSGFWRFRGHMSEARDQFTRLLVRQKKERPSSNASLTRLAWALDELAGFCMFQGDPNAAQPLLEESLALFRELEDSEGVAEALSDYGLLFERLGDYEQAVNFFQESLTLLRKLQKPTAIALNLFFLGAIAHVQSNLQHARSFLEESLRILRVTENTVLLGSVLCTLAGIEIEQGIYDQARVNLLESLTILKKINERWQIIAVLEMYACLATAEGQSNQAKNLRSAKLFGATVAIRQLFDVETPRVTKRLNDKYVSLLRTQFDQATMATAWAEGRAMTLDQAVGYALNETI